VTQELLTRKSNDHPTKHQSGPIAITMVLSEGAGSSEKQTESLIEQLQTVFNNGRYVPGPISITVTTKDEVRDGADRSEDNMEKLRRAVESLNQQNREAQSTANPFQFYANILGTKTSSQEGSKVCAILDTASADNWIAASIVERFGLQDWIQPAVEVPCTGAGGNLFYAKGMISVLWTRNSAKSWETKFLIQENAPFDMLLGRKFIVEEGMLILADPVLVHDNVSRLAPLSKGMLPTLSQHSKSCCNSDFAQRRRTKWSRT
jgi:hypothetical protein